MIRLPLKLKIFTDGGARGNPGPAAAGWAIYKGNELVTSGSKYLGVTTNNVAEYQALILALGKISKYALEDVDEVGVYMDSELAVKQIKGNYKINKPHLLVLYQKVKAELIRLGKTVHVEHVSRDKNILADSMVNECLDANQLSRK